MLFKIRVSLFVLVIFSVVNSIKVSSNANGSPGNYSGVNGSNCTSCHSTNPLNNGSGSVVITMIDSSGNIDSTYIPGKKYTVTIKVKRSGSLRWGFAAAAKTVSGTTLNFSKLSGNTKINSGYATQSNDLTDSFALSWTAPVKGTGDVNIYACGNAANGNGKKSGDYIYTQVVKISEATLTSLETETANDQDFKIFHLNENQICIQSTYSGLNSTYYITDMSGRLVCKNVLSSDNQIICINNNFTNQILICTIMNSKGKFSKKFILNQ